MELFQPLSKKAGLGVVIRDSNGHAVICRAKQRHLCSPLMVECEVALLGLQTAIALGIKKLEVEGDSMKVISALKENLEECDCEIRLCVADCKSII